jgi:hypothetical protein
MTRQRTSATQRQDSQEATRLGGRTRRCDAAATRTLQRSLLAPGQAWAFVDEQLCPLHGPNAIAAMRLVTSEVVLHAVRNGEGPVVVTVECDATSVTVSVSCDMRAPTDGARLQLGDPISSRIVDSICRASGIAHTARGLTMWCTLPTGHLWMETGAHRAVGPEPPGPLDPTASRSRDVS